MINLNVKLADLEDKVAATDHPVSWRCCFSIEREGVRTRQKLLNASLTIPLRHVKTRDIISTFVFVDIVLRRIRINPSDFYSVYMYLGLLGHFFAPPPFLLFVVVASPMDSAIQYLVQHKLKEQTRYQVINIPSRFGTKNHTSYRRLKNTDQILLDWKDPT